MDMYLHINMAANNQAQAVTHTVTESASGLGFELEKIVRKSMQRGCTWRIEGGAVQVLDRAGNLIGVITNQ